MAVSAKNVRLVEEELKKEVRNVLMVLLCRCSQCFSEWENDCGCLKRIKLGGVHKIVLHNANYPEGSDTAMRAFLCSSHSLHTIFHRPCRFKRGHRPR